MLDKVIALAGQMSGAFTGETRPNGDHFRKLSYDAPEWMTDVVRAAHMDSDILPDDWIFDKVENAVDHIAGLDGDLDDAAHEFADLNCDFGNGQLVAWLGGNLRYSEYVDNAAQEFGVPADECIFRRIQSGQYLFLRDMFESVVSALESVADDMPDEEDGE